jgi:hypothetical protein
MIRNASCYVKRIAEDGSDYLGSLSDDEVEGAVLALKEHVDASNAAMHRTIAELDRRAIPERARVLTTKQWLRRFCRFTGAEAARSLTTARALDSMPTVAKRAHAGEIPIGHLQRLAAVQQRHHDDFALHEPVFADIATYLDASDLRRAVDHWRQQVSSEAAVDAAKQVSRRRLSIGQTFEGMWHLDADLDPESGHIVATVLRAHADPGLINPGDSRTHGQRMADALTDVARFSLDHDEGLGTSAGTKPHITVTVDIRQLIGSGDVLPNIDGAPVSTEAIRRLTCDAGVTRIVMEGESLPLDVGRTVRTVTPAIRRALDARDRGCTWDGCDAPLAWCDAHHVVHWVDGGSTSLDNMALLCRRHHTATHEGRMSPPVPRAQPPPDG